MNFLVDMFSTHFFNRTCSARIWPTATIVFILTNSYFNAWNHLNGKKGGINNGCVGGFQLPASVVIPTTQTSYRRFKKAVWYFDVQGWRSGESTRLPPMWPGFDSQTRRHMWVEFVGSLRSSERFYTSFSHLTKI